MKPAQVRMARAALRWSLQDLANAAKVHRNTITNFENERYAGSPDALAAIQTALENAGIELIDENGDGAAVRLRKIRGLSRQLRPDEGDSEPADHGANADHSDVDYPSDDD